MEMANQTGDGTDAGDRVRQAADPGGGGGHQAPDAGRIVVTGATSGIGLATVALLTESGWPVIALGRSRERCDTAMEDLGGAGPESLVTWVTADFSSFRAVREAADQILAKAQSESFTLRALVNNAGAVTSRHMTTRDGLEQQFQVNHLSPFLLTHLLLPGLAGAPGSSSTDVARIINVTSGSHRGARIYWNDLNLRGRYNTLRAYRQSKFANLLVTYELARRIPGGAGLRSFALDPGLVRTGIGVKGTNWPARTAWRIRSRSGISPDVPAARIVELATTDVHRLPNSVYQSVDHRSGPSDAAQDPEAGSRMWRLTEKLCGVDFTSGLAKREADA